MGINRDRSACATRRRASRHICARVGLIHGRLEAAVERPGLGEALPVGPHAGLRSGELGRAQARSSPAPPAGRPARPECRQGTASSSRWRPCRHRRAAPFRAAAPPVAAHGLEQIARLVADAFERRAGRISRRAGIARSGRRSRRAPRHPSRARRARRRPAPDRHAASGSACAAERAASRRRHR